MMDESNEALGAAETRTIRICAEAVAMLADAWCVNEYKLEDTKGNQVASGREGQYSEAAGNSDASQHQERRFDHNL